MAASHASTIFHCLRDPELSGKEVYKCFKHFFKNTDNIFTFLLSRTLLSLSQIIHGPVLLALMVSWVFQTSHNFLPKALLNTPSSGMRRMQPTSWLLVSYPVCWALTSLGKAFWGVTAREYSGTLNTNWFLWDYMHLYLLAKNRKTAQWATSIII